MPLFTWSSLLVPLQALLDRLLGKFPKFWWHLIMISMKSKYWSFYPVRQNRNPFDVLKTLSQTNQGKSIPLASLVGQMYSDQGVKGFYRGVQVNIMRACVLNATKMGVYDISKGKVVNATGWSRKDPRTAFCSSFVAGFFMTCTVVSRDGNFIIHWISRR